MARKTTAQTTFAEFGGIAAIFGGREETDRCGGAVRRRDSHRIVSERGNQRERLLLLEQRVSRSGQTTPVPHQALDCLSPVEYRQQQVLSVA
jgi:hypothetical protein